MVSSSYPYRNLPALLRGGVAPSGRMRDIHKAFSTRGVGAGIQALNDGVAHRYTGIFRIEGDMLQNTHLFDKRGQVRPEGLESVKLSDSFCQVALRDGALLSDNTGDDERLDFSPYQNMVMSYHGVPILNLSGELYGTLCHFDFVEQSMSAEEFACMQEAARLIPLFLF